MVKTSLRELLQLKSDMYGPEAKKKREIIEEWQSALDRLFAQFRTWLAESDPTRILAIEEAKAEVNEEYLGRYQVPRIDIKAFDLWLAIIPKARFNVRTARPPQYDAPEWATYSDAEHLTGRVDITNEITRFVLYRYPDPEGNTWYIEGPLDAGPKPLTRELFEEAITRYFL